MARLAWHRPNWRRPTQRIAPLTWPISGWRHGESNPGPPACKLAAGSAFAVAERLRGATGGAHARLVLGSLPYFSGVRASSPRTSGSCNSVAAALASSGTSRRPRANELTRTDPETNPFLVSCRCPSASRPLWSDGACNSHHCQVRSIRPGHAGLFVQNRPVRDHH
jgi:hypothetical protein